MIARRKEYIASKMLYHIISNVSIVCEGSNITCSEAKCEVNASHGKWLNAMVVNDVSKEFDNDLDSESA